MSLECQQRHNYDQLVLKLQQDKNGLATKLSELVVNGSRCSALLLGFVAWLCCSALLMVLIYDDSIIIINNNNNNINIINKY